MNVDILKKLIKKISTEKVKSFGLKKSNDYLRGLTVARAIIIDELEIQQVNDANTKKEECTLHCVSNLLPHDAWSLENVFKKLVEASEILLYQMNYDGDKWEQISHCSNRGKEIVKKLDSNNC